MAEADRQLNYWFGNPNLETQISMPGGGFGRASPVRPSVPANDPTMNVQRAANYDAALRQQQILNASQDAHIGDFKYWENIARNEGHLGEITGKPNALSAAEAYSKGGKTTVVIRSNGQRHVFHNGEQVVQEFGSDLPK